MPPAAGSLPVNEIFETIQGEATHAGTPSVFVRLQGCDVGCPWCDTRMTWTLDPTKEISLSAMLAKAEDDDSFAAVGVSTLIQTVKAFQARHVVITGGEPCRYDLQALTHGLIDSGYSVQIETSGTEDIRADDRTWVTLSPKFNMPGGRSVSEHAFRRANEIKMPVGRPADIERLVRACQAIEPTAAIWLQPLSTSQKATELCIAACTRHQWRLSIQTHKYIGVR